MIQSDWKKKKVPENFLSSWNAISGLSMSSTVADELTNT